MKSDLKPQQKKSNAYLRYSGLAFQLAALVLVAFYSGRWIDGALHLSIPIFTMGLIILLFSIFMYKLYMDLNKDR